MMKKQELNVVKEDYAIISTSYGDMTVKFFEGTAKACRKF